MRIITVDDEIHALRMIVKELKNAFPDALINDYQNWQDALRYVEECKAQKVHVDYIFLDIQLAGMNGIELAKKIKIILPKTNIIFCTSYSEYAYEAYNVHAKGYLLKPVTVEDLTRTLEIIKCDWSMEQKQNHCIAVHTFGSFDVYIDLKPLDFELEKVRELFAYLIDKHGEFATEDEIAQALFADKASDKETKKQTSSLIAILKKTLKKNGIESIIVAKRKKLAIDSSKIKCDYYDYQTGDVTALNSYRGQYMTNYKWASFTYDKLVHQVLK